MLKKIKGKIKKYCKKLIDLFLLFLAYALFYAVKYFMPYQVTSIIGYILGSTIMYYLPIQRKRESLKNIQLAFPNKNKQECKNIYRKSCINFVRVLFEFPKIESLVKDKKAIKINDVNHVIEKKQKALFFTAHLSNWQLNLAPFVSKEDSYLIYKIPNNKGVDDILLKSMMNGKDTKYKHKMITLSRERVFFLKQKLKQDNANIVMLIDQRIKEGIAETTFFKRQVKTSHFLPMLAIRYDAPLIPIKLVRKSIWRKPYFEITIEEPLHFEKSDNSKIDILNLTQVMNNKVEEWVYENAGEWFWLHRRW